MKITTFLFHSYTFVHLFQFLSLCEIDEKHNFYTFFCGIIFVLFNCTSWCFYRLQKQLYNHKCPTVCLLVSHQNPSTVWNHHPSSIILHHSSFILHHSSFILHYSSFILHYPSSFFIHPSFIMRLLSFSACFLWGYPLTILVVTTWLKCFNNFMLQYADLRI